MITETSNILVSVVILFLFRRNTKTANRPHSLEIKIDVR